jgi:hypothetical protein
MDDVVGPILSGTARATINATPGTSFSVCRGMDAPWECVGNDRPAIVRGHFMTPQLTVFTGRLAAYGPL